MVMKSLARDGSLDVLQLAAASRDDEASGVAFLLCLTRMDLSKSSLDALSFLTAASGHMYAALVDSFGKTPARVDEYFTLKKVETDWALEWARPAG